jgi:hypothetical protein
MFAVQLGAQTQFISGSHLAWTQTVNQKENMFGADVLVLNSHQPRECQVQSQRLIY